MLAHIFICWYEATISANSYCFKGLVLFTTPLYSACHVTNTWIHSSLPPSGTLNLIFYMSPFSVIFCLSDTHQYSIHNKLSLSYFLYHSVLISSINSHFAVLICCLCVKVFMCVVSLCRSLASGSTMLLLEREESHSCCFCTASPSSGRSRGYQGCVNPRLHSQCKM